MRRKLQLMGVTAASTMALGASMAMPLASFAAMGETSVVNSGDDAAITTTLTDTQVVTINNSNTSTTNQTMTGISNTGNNTSSGNIGGSGSIMTGAATATGVFGVEANSNVTGISMPMTNALSGMSTEVVNTGDDAEVDSVWSSYKSLNIGNTNTANTTQSFTGSSNTGYNGLDGNISQGGASGIQAGAAGVSAVMGVDVNKNATTVNGLGGASGAVGSGLSLTNTGTDADINSTLSNTSVLGVSNYNTATAYQAVSATSNTGNNGVVDGIGGGAIMTGPAAAGAQFGAHANSNLTGIAGWGGTMLGTVAEYVNTGDGLVGNNTMANSFTASVGSTNSMYDTQMFAFSQNSGYNYADGNIGGTGLTSTGAAASGGNAQVAGNTNATVFGSVADVLMFLALGQ